MSASFETSTGPTEPAAAAVQAFITRWQGVTASELATSQSFLIELCGLLNVEAPTHEPHYQFERPITFRHGDGSTSTGRIDCYRRGHFVWESKKLKDGERQAAAGNRRFDEALLRARQQAEDYARALPASEGRPPFLVVVDVGHVIELYAEFSRSGATYTPFPDPRSHRIRLADLAQPPIRQRLRALWTDPLSLDPARISARVTREVAAELAELARSLESAGHAPQTVAAFLTRCLFSMFAEDVGLLPKAQAAVRAELVEALGSFAHLLTTWREQPATLANMLRVFWDGMDRGGFNPAIARDVLRFNGKLFKGANSDGYVLPLNAAQIDGLLRAARANWQEVEPAIFGTLLERALSPIERHALGAHYTPRAYVERLVLPTVIEPLRADWANAQAAALVLAREADELDGKKRDAKLDEARAEIRRFHHQLCSTRVLDPACGSANFLYVTLEHLKRLEGEVLNQLEALGQTQDALALEGETVTLQQLRGIELNERAAALAELVLWIGWLQWHVRTRGVASVAEPVVHDYRNIECRDAVLAYDEVQPALDDAGRPITRWDGTTFKKHPVTGEDVPDEAAQVPQWRYVNPRPAAWPQADFIVGNPPYIGARTIRQALGEGYLDAVRQVHPHVPDNADFVMYWWDKAAGLVARKETQQFGLITTNSLRQTFNRAVLERWLLPSEEKLSLTFVIPDHPWVDSADGAAVRVAMTVGRHAQHPGRLLSVTAEKTSSSAGEVEVTFAAKEGVITPGLSIGVDVPAAHRLRANAGMSCVGYQLTGRGFRLTSDEAALIDREFGQPHSRVQPLLTGSDITQNPSGTFALDLYGLSLDELRTLNPAAYQRVFDTVKPERDQNNRPALRERWWIFGEARSTFRPALDGCRRAVVTSLTAKHRTFVLVDAKTICDSTTVMFALPDAVYMGVLSSQAHVDWALAAGGTLEDRPRYNKSVCFETFPFPHDDTGLTPELAARIRSLAEQLDAHRKARQAAHEGVTLTGMYNVLGALRRGQPLSAKDKTLHAQALVSVLQSLHDELDAAVLAAYGWSDLGPVPWADDAARAEWTEALLERLVALNARRAAEEAGTAPVSASGGAPGGTVRWLRPEFQDPVRRTAAQAAAQASDTSPVLATPSPATPVPEQSEITGLADADAANDAEPPQADGDAATPATVTASQPTTRQAWPADLPAQVRAVAEVLGASPAPLTELALADRFTGRGPWKKRLPQILSTLEAVGRAQRVAAGWRG